MNKDLLDQVPVEEQPVASKLNALIDDMQPSQAFQWDLENQLMEKAVSTRPVQSWFLKIIVPVGWGIAAIASLFLLNWTVHSLVPQIPPAAGQTATQELSFADKVRAGNICRGPLAVGHGFVVFLTNPEKPGFTVVDAGNTIVESRSFNWSADGEQLAIVGNSMGSGNIYLTDRNGAPPQPILPDGEVGYLMDAAWSRDGEQLVMWSSQDNRVLYLMNTDGTKLVEKHLDVQVLGTPQFWPDGRGVVFYGADTNSMGLFEMMLADSQVRLINPLVEQPGSYGFSPDGSQLAYMEYDRELGEARLILEDLTTHEIAYLGSLSIPKGYGSSVPETANLSWSPDGNFLVFDFGRSPVYRAVYLAKTGGSNFVKIADSAYAPAISGDGKCIAYISNYQVFLVHVSSGSVNSTAATSMVVADLPSGRGMINFKQDKLQWRP